VLRFGYLTPDILMQGMLHVCASEGVTYDESALTFISEHSNGSLRKAIQGVEENVDANNHLSFELVTADRLLKEAENAKELLKKAFSNDIEGYETQLFRLHYKGGFCAAELLESILKEINIMQMSPEIRQALIIQLAEYDWRISQGANELLQMRCFLGTLHYIVNGQK
jgi:replication factor C small subunit